MSHAFMSSAFKFFAFVSTAFALFFSYMTAQSLLTRPQWVSRAMTTTATTATTTSTQKPTINIPRFVEHVKSDNSEPTSVTLKTSCDEAGRDARIVGRPDARSGQWPSISSILRHNTREGKELQCGGDLIDENYLEQDYDSDVSDFLVWSSIVTSIAKWSDRKKERERARLKRQMRQTVHQNGSTTTTTTVTTTTTRSLHRRRRNEEVVCYDNFGCFRDEGPFDYLDTLPASPQSIATTFTLYTRRNSMDGETLYYDNTSSLLVSNFNASNPVKVIIHGFGSSGKRPWVMQMTEALLFMDDFNVIVVDWENGATLPNYVQAAANTQLIGKQIARLIREINANQDMTAGDYHLIGFSLGAHVAGFTGMEIANISRITGLDPAAPLFEGYPSRVRLDPTDAHFVDVIHSNGDSFFRGGLGSFAAMGHVDFYPNGGRVQVGCNSVFMGAITDIIYGKWNSLCNHRRAFRFFIDSVVPECTFRAHACESYDEYVRGNCFTCGSDGTKCSNMGYYAHHSIGRGNMYLVTRQSEPFCANQFRIRVISTTNQGSTWGKLEVQFVAKDGSNETFTLTNESDEIKDSGYIQGLVVAHPNIQNVCTLIVTYTRYKGWIYSGKESWSIDKIELTNSNTGHVVSYCGYSTRLNNSVAFQLTLLSGNCTLNHQIIQTIQSQHITSSTITSVPVVSPQRRIAKFFWHVIGEPIKDVNHRSPKLTWKMVVSEEQQQSDVNDEQPLLDADKYFWYV